MVDDNIRYSPLILSAEDQATFDKENAQDEAQQELLKKMKHASSATTLAPSVTASTLVVAALPTVGIDMAPAIKTIQQKLDESSTKLRLAREQALAVKAENDRKQAAAVEELLQNQLRQEEQERKQSQAKKDQEQKDLEANALLAAQEANDKIAAEIAKQQKEKDAPMEEARRLCTTRFSVEYPNFFRDAMSYVISLEKAQPLPKKEHDLQTSVEHFIISNLSPESPLSAAPKLILSEPPAQETGDEKKMRELKDTLAKSLYDAQLLQYDAEQEFAFASKQMLIESARETLGDSISNALKSFGGLKATHIGPMRQTLVEWKIFQQKLQ